ncbi:ATP-grasp domain-containing protein [Caldinitratiruptor microaerophilus]|uniref:ATP-grasp domain-containing protein n=1 Tax=Caldinitratiruptor microaerophilus TaxID=671077 RepID=UPI00222E3424|nr:ATP-grasp domain-containing protein [Caldinitratiruptor microaerophilus]
MLLAEYATGGGLPGGPLEAGLLAEGLAMLTALLADFARSEGYELLSLVDCRTDRDSARRLRSAAPGARIEAIEPGQLREELAERILWADAALVVAPETAGVLADLTAVIERAGKLNLGSSAAAAALAGDKLLTFQRLADAKLPVPPCLELAPGDPLPPPGWSLPVVVKPRDGCGAEGVRLVREAGRWEGEAGYVVQPHIRGKHASASLLVSRGRAVALSLNAQHVRVSAGRYVYLGGRVPLAHPLAERALAVACRAAEAIPGLGGYVGVDLVLSGGEAYVIEVNPRLTTAVVGLREVLPWNLADLLVGAARGELPAAPPALAGSVAFRKDGRLRVRRAPAGSPVGDVEP